MLISNSTETFLILSICNILGVIDYVSVFCKKVVCPTNDTFNHLQCVFNTECVVEVGIFSILTLRFWYSGIGFTIL